MTSRQAPPMPTADRPPGGHHDNRSTRSTRTGIPRTNPGGGRPRTTPKPLNFQQAMSDFGVMFPEIDRDVIEAVLRANNGVVQTTIDQLLELQESTIIEKAANDGAVLPSYESSIGAGEEPPPAYNDIWEDVGAPLPDPLFPNSRNKPHPSLDTRPKSNDNQPKTFPRNSLWNAPLVGKLPDDFLKLDPSPPQVFRRKTNTGTSLMTSSIGSSDKEFMTDDDVERFMEDEKLAMFLQNEEFLRQLRRDREFVSSLEADHQKAMIASGNPVPQTPSSVACGGARPRTTPMQEDAQFRQKLRHMGKSTRKKFGKMAKKFSRTKTTGRPQLATNMTPSESTFNLLGDDEFDDERTSQHQESLYDIDEDDRIENNIEEIAVDKEFNRSGDIHMQRPRPRPSVRTGRQLPQPPSATPQSRLNDEPIVFYGEDNEFNFKNE